MPTGDCGTVENREELARIRQDKVSCSDRSNYEQSCKYYQVGRPVFLRRHFLMQNTGKNTACRFI